MDKREKEFYKKILHASLQRLFDELWKVVAVGGLIAFGGYLAFREVEKHEPPLFESTCKAEETTNE